MSKKELLPPNPKEKSEVKQVLSDKIKTKEQGKIVQK